MPQEDKKEVKIKPTLFSEKNDIVTKEELQEYEEIMTEKFFRFIVSPERQDIPLKTMIRLFIDKLEKRTGYKFYWFSTEHHDTMRQHVHLLINGKDKNGKEVRFDYRFFQTEFRKIAMDVCTAIKGERSEYEIRQDLEKRTRVDRWTRFDKEIKENIKPYNDKDFPYVVVSQNSDMELRLLYLADKEEYAKKDGMNGYPGRFLLRKDWEKRLRNNFMYNSYVQEKQKLLYNRNVELQLYDNKNDLDKINRSEKYKIIKVINEDFEVTRQNALIVQGGEKYWYIPSPKFLPKSLVGRSYSFFREETSKEVEHSPVPDVTPKPKQKKDPTKGKDTESLGL